MTKTKICRQRHCRNQKVPPKSNLKLVIFNFLEGSLQGYDRCGPVHQCTRNNIFTKAENRLKNSMPSIKATVFIPFPQDIKNVLLQYGRDVSNFSLYLRQDSKQLHKTSDVLRMRFHLIAQPIYNTTITPVFNRYVRSQSSNGNTNLKCEKVNFQLQDKIKIKATNIPKFT